MQLSSFDFMRAYIIGFNIYKLVVISPQRRVKMAEQT